MTLFQKIKAAGIPYSNHSSDLYLPDTAEVRQIIKECEKERCLKYYITSFYQIDKPWLDVTFQYDPFWEEKNLNREKELQDPNSMAV